MQFKIKNLNNTFISIELKGRSVTAPARGTIGPFSDSILSKDALAKDRKGSIVIIKVPLVKKAQEKEPEKKPEKKYETIKPKRSKSK